MVWTIVVKQGQAEKITRSAQSASVRQIRTTDRNHRFS